MQYFAKLFYFDLQHKIKQNIQENEMLANSDKYPNY